MLNSVHKNMEEENFEQETPCMNKEMAQNDHE